MSLRFSFKSLFLLSHTLKWQPPLPVSICISMCSVSITEIIVKKKLYLSQPIRLTFLQMFHPIRIITQSSRFTLGPFCKVRRAPPRPSLLLYLHLTRGLFFCGADELENHVSLIVVVHLISHTADDLMPSPSAVRPANRVLNEANALPQNAQCFL